jgi:hypothetical protein
MYRPKIPLSSSPFIAHILGVGKEEVGGKGNGRKWRAGCVQ